MLAERLKQKGYKFHLDMYGDGEYRKMAETKVKSHGLSGEITIHGNVPNTQVREAMKKSDIFLFTSDRYEGWGAVANESLSNGCVLVASDAIGSSPYLIENGVNGYLFHSAHTTTGFANPDQRALDDLTNKVVSLLENRARLCEMKRKAVTMMQSYWSPKRAAESLLQLIDDLQNGRETSIKEGPCSKA